MKLHQKLSAAAAITGLAMGIALFGGTVPASAATSGTHAVVSTTVTSAIAVLPSDGGGCSLADWGGSEVCNSRGSLWTMPDGRQQVFVIGTDYAVWTRWELTPGGLLSGAVSDWKSLGGTVAASNPYVTGTSSVWAVTLQVQGTDGNLWFLNRQGVVNGSWNTWHLSN